MQVLLIKGFTFGLSPFVFALGDDVFADFIAGIQFLVSILHISYYFYKEDTLHVVCMHVNFPFSYKSISLFFGRIYLSYLAHDDHDGPPMPGW